MAIELAPKRGATPAHEPVTTEAGLAITAPPTDVLALRRASKRTTYLAAAGAALALAAGLMFYVRATRRSAPVGWRAPAEPEVKLLVPDDAVVDRDAVVLRWEAVAPAARYAVIVSTDALATVVSVTDLDATSLPVPSGALAPMPAGSVLIWRVIAMLPDGTTIDSKSRRLRLR